MSEQKQLSFGERVAQIQKYLEENQERIFSGAAAGVDPTRYIALLIDAIGRDKSPEKNLSRCMLHTHAMALADSATLGLPINGVMGHGYVVPYKNEAQFQPGYQGLIQLAYESPYVSGIDADVRRDGDYWRFVKGTHPQLEHTPGESADAPVLGYYAIAWLKNDRCRVVYWPQSKVEQHKSKYARGVQKPDSAWNTAFEAMALKTVVRHCLKLVPVGSDAARVVLNRDEYVEAGILEKRFQPGDEAPQDELNVDLDPASVPCDEEGRELQKTPF